MARQSDDLKRLALLHHYRGGGAHLGLGPMLAGGRGRARRGDVRVALLLLLAEEPRNGYQLMQAIEERSGGRWRPSPGSVYPALAQLEDQGFVQAIERDETKLFEITDAGRSHLAERHEVSAPWECEDDADDGIDMKKLIGQVAVAAMQVAQAGDRQQLKQAANTLAETRRALYRILAEDDGA
jgi:DNA-binding PadR family transcriptional regulator